MAKLQCTFHWLVIYIGPSLLIFCSQLHCLVLDADISVRSLNSVDDNGAGFFICWVTNGLLFFKNEHARLIIIQNGNSSYRVSSMKPLISSLIVELDVEVLVGLPPVVINNLHRYYFFGLTLLEKDFLVNRLVV